MKKILLTITALLALSTPALAYEKIQLGYANPNVTTSDVNTNFFPMLNGRPLQLTGVGTYGDTANLAGGDHQVQNAIDSIVPAAQAALDTAIQTNYPNMFEWDTTQLIRVDRIDYSNDVAALLGSVNTVAFKNLLGYATVANTGSYNDLSNKPSIPSSYSVGTPTSRTVALATAYQCTTNTKPCTFTLTVACPTLSVVLGTTCAGEVRIGSASTIATGASGTIIAPITRTVSGVLGLTSSDYETKTIQVPTGWYIAVRQTVTSTGAGAITVPAAFDQVTGN